MVEHIPLAAVFGDAAVVVPHLGVAAEVIDDDAAIGEGPQRRGGCGIAQACGALAMAAGVGVDVIIQPAVFAHGAALVEVVLCHAQRLYDGLGIDGAHARQQPGRAHAVELPPVDVGLPVVIYKHAGVNAIHSLDGRGVGEGPLRGRAFGHTFGAVGQAEIQVIAAVPTDAIRRVQRAVGPHPRGGGILGGKADAIGPMHEVVAAEHMIELAAIVAASGDVPGAIQIQAILKDAGLRIGHIGVGVQQRVMGERQVFHVSSGSRRRAAPALTL